MPRVPQALIELPLLVSFVTFMLRYYVLEPRNRLTDPRFVGGAVAITLFILYIAMLVARAGALVSVIFFVLALATAAAAFGDVWVARQRRLHPAPETARPR